MAKVKAKKSEEIKETKKDIKKKQKQVKKVNYKKEKEVSEPEQEAKRFVVILVILIAIIGALYLFTNKGSDNTNTNETVIQYDEISVGMILNRSEYKEYYVLAYFDDGENYTDINKLYRTFRNRDGVIKLYTVDLNDAINSSFVDKEGTASLNVTNVNEFKFTTDTLLYIKDGKIEKVYSDFKSIEKILK